MKELTNRLGQTEEEFLRSYNPDRYQKPSVTVDMLIFTVAETEEQNYRRLSEKELKILLVKRGNHPYIGRWALPGGFINIDESLEDAASRELQEETGLKHIYMEQLYTFGDVDRDPRMRVISSSYIALVGGDSLNLEAGDDADDARWFSVKSEPAEDNKKPAGSGFRQERIYNLKLESGEIKLNAKIRCPGIAGCTDAGAKACVLENDALAFDHALIIQYALKRLRGKILYSNIAFNLMPEYFTLGELQQVYETILGRKLYSASFRRKIKNMVVKTGRVSKAVGHRPSALYRYNPEREGYRDFI